MPTTGPRAHGAVLKTLARAYPGLHIREMGDHAEVQTTQETVLAAAALVARNGYFLAGIVAEQPLGDETRLREPLVEPPDGLEPALLGREVRAPVFARLGGLLLDRLRHGREATRPR